MKNTAKVIETYNDGNYVTILLLKQSSSQIEYNL